LSIGIALSRSRADEGSGRADCPFIRQIESWEETQGENRLAFGAVSLQNVGPLTPFIWQIESWEETQVEIRLVFGWL